MNTAIRNRLMAWLVFTALGIPAGAAQAADPAPRPMPPPMPLPQPRPDMVLKGDAVCTRCHDESEPYPVLSIAKTKHGTVADGRMPTCTSCHGESKSHVENLRKEGEKDRPKPDRTFEGPLRGSGRPRRGLRPPPPPFPPAVGQRSTVPVAERNAPCLTCHQGGKRVHWQGSVHETRDVACTSCHQVHTAHDRVRDKLTQSDVCFMCHKEQRVQINRMSRHPILEGKVGCSDCHNPHGTAGAKLLVRDNVNDTCYTCHMEKRGPFVRNHQPVTEDCSICHNPHGTTVEPAEGAPAVPVPAVPRAHQPPRQRAALDRHHAPARSRRRAAA